MLVVCTHPDQQMRPFVDHVPRLETEVDAMMTIWKDIARGHDVRGGSTSDPHLEGEMEAELGALVAQSQAEEAEAPQDAQCPASPAAEDVPRPEEDDETLRRCKKRRLLPGATQSMPKFQGEFSNMPTTARKSLEAALVKESEQCHSLLHQSSRMISQIRSMRPEWPEQLVRVVACACILPHMRLCDAYLREHIYLLWLMEGGRYLRVHNGQCFLYHDCGAFQVFRGSPPEQTVARVKEFILQLEGLFRCLGGGVERTTPSIVDAVDSMETERGGNIKAMLDSWIDAAIFMKQVQPARRLQQFDEDGDEQADGIGIAACGWAQSIATALSKMSVTLQKEVMDDKIYGLMIEWCETPSNKRAGCAYKDLCVVYDSQEGNIMFVQPSHANNIYTLIPHALKPALPDPVLQAATCLD